MIRHLQVRSSPAPRQDCALGPRDQINQITSYLDGSNIYGSTAEEQHDLRLMAKGKLKYTDLHIRKPLLPPLNPLASSEECRYNLTLFIAKHFVAGFAPQTYTASTRVTTVSTSSRGWPPCTPSG